VAQPSRTPEALAERRRATLDDPGRLSSPDDLVGEIDGQPVVGVWGPDLDLYVTGATPHQVVRVTSGGPPVPWPAGERARSTSPTPWPPPRAPRWSSRRSPDDGRRHRRGRGRGHLHQPADAGAGQRLGLAHLLVTGGPGPSSPPPAPREQATAQPGTPVTAVATAQASVATQVEQELDDLGQRRREALGDMCGRRAMGASASAATPPTRPRRPVGSPD
jgi:hypothetical protein